MSSPRPTKAQRIDAPGRMILLQRGSAELDFSRPPDRVRFVVEDGVAGARLDAYLAGKMDWRSRTAFQQMIARGDVLVNNRPAVRPATRLQPGDTVELRIPQPAPLPAKDPVKNIPLRVLYEDHWLLALDKPPGVVVHPTGKQRLYTLLGAVHHRYRNARGDDPGLDPRGVHRLDRDTSGVILFTKRAEARGPFQAQFENRATKKEYLALALGDVKIPAAVPGVTRDGEQSFTVDLPIGPRRGSPIRIAMGVRRDAGLPSKTRFQILERSPRLTLLVAQPLTGRQHQIRVHLEAIGHPVACDPYYGPGGAAHAKALATERRAADKGDSKKFALPRLGLHAHRLGFHHPFAGRDMVLSAPLADDLKAALRSVGMEPGRYS